MRILIDIWSLASENGGPTRSAKGLATALAKAGCEVVLVSHVPGKTSLSEIEALENAGVKFVVGNSNKYGIALKDSRRILDECKPDIVHTQGLWKMSTHAMNVAAHERNIPVVISPRGMLDPWALSVKKWKKLLGMFLYQKDDLRRAIAFHATAEMEAEHIRRFGLKQPIIIAPNGVEIPPNEMSNGEDTRYRNVVEGPERIALFLSRLHPGKGLLLLAEAWAKVKPKGWKMVVVGPDRYGHKREVENKLNALGVVNDWIFMGEVNDKQKWLLYKCANLFIHPSVSENFGISIAEALASGTPVITTTGTPWRDLMDFQCGWWIDLSVDNLVRILGEAMALSDEQREDMGLRGMELIKSQYTWLAIGRKMKTGYESLFCR